MKSLRPIKSRFHPVFVVLALLCAHLVASQIAEDDPPFLKALQQPLLREDYRLAEWLRPVSYDVNLTVGIRGVNGAEKSYFKGRASLKFKVEGNASNILEIHVGPDYAVTVDDIIEGKEPIKVLSTRQNKPKQTIVLTLASDLQADQEYSAQVAWEGAARHDMRGLYEMRQTYADYSNTYTLGTHGEPMGTRLWMPCFDEPAMKAILHLTVTHPRSHTARSNGPVAERVPIEDQPSMLRTSFKPTPLISTYLFALTVVNFEEEKWEYQGIQMSVVAEKMLPIGALVGHANKSMHVFMNIFKAPIIFEKLDFVFHPDFEYGAMENVGHISVANRYHNSYFLYVHEMMHNYFGNLVTLSWWDEVWLNEGLTTLYEYDLNYYGWELEERFRTARRGAMDIDSTLRTVALKNPTASDFSARSIFDKTFKKGPVILNMMRTVLGKDVWKEGIEKYLNKFAYKAATGDDFISTMCEVAKKHHNQSVVDFVDRMARDFFEKPGYPLLRMSQNGTSVSFHQQRFHNGFINGDKKEDKYIWALPIHLVKMDGTSVRTLLMTKKEETITLDTDEPVMLNPTEIVYYRVVYDQSTNDAIKTAGRMNDKQVITYLHDLIHALFAGYVEPDAALPVLLGHYMYRAFSKALMHQIQKNKIALIQPERQFPIWNLYEGDNRTDFERRSEVQRYTPRYDCEGLNVSDIYHDYFKAGIHVFFCEKIAKSWTGYRGLVEEVLSPSGNSIIRASNGGDIMQGVNKIKPGFVAETLLDMVKKANGDENRIANLLFRAAPGLDVTCTKELREIAEIAPGAALQHRDLIMRIFEERQAIESEEELLGAKIFNATKTYLEELKKRPFQ